MKPDITVRFADRTEAADVVQFQQRYLLPDNPAVYSREFLCPKGVQAAVLKGQMIVALADNEIVGAVRGN